MTARLTGESSFKLHRCHQEDHPAPPYPSCHVIYDWKIFPAIASGPRNKIVNPNQVLNKFSLNLPLFMPGHIWDSKSQKFYRTVHKISKLPQYGPLLISTTSANLSWAKKEKKETDFKVVPCCQTKQPTAERRVVFRVVKIHKNPWLNRQLYPSFPCTVAPLHYWAVWLEMSSLELISSLSPRATWQFDYSGQFCDQQH